MVTLVDLPRKTIQIHYWLVEPPAEIGQLISPIVSDSHLVWTWFPQETHWIWKGWSSIAGTADPENLRCTVTTAAQVPPYHANMVQYSCVYLYMTIYVYVYIYIYRELYIIINMYCIYIYIHMYNYICIITYTYIWLYVYDLLSWNYKRSTSTWYQSTFNGFPFKAKRNLKVPRGLIN